MQVNDQSYGSYGIGVLRVLHHSLRKRIPLCSIPVVVPYAFRPVRRIPSPWPSLGFCKRQDIRRSEKRELLEPLVHRGSAAEKYISRAASKKIQRKRLTYFTCSDWWTDIVGNNNNNNNNNNNRYKSRSFFWPFLCILLWRQGLQSSWITVNPSEVLWVFPKIGVPQNGWFIMENPIKMDDLGGKPTIFGNVPIMHSPFL